MRGSAPAPSLRTPECRRTYDDPSNLNRKAYYDETSVTLTLIGWKAYYDDPSATVQVGSKLFQGKPYAGQDFTETLDLLKTVGNLRRRLAKARHVIEYQRHGHSLQVEPSTGQVFCAERDQILNLES